MTLSFEPIGFLKADSKYRFEAPRQSTLAENFGVIHLNGGHNFEQALEDLGGFDRIWVIYTFHLNKSWKPKINPPRSEKKLGVFATRSPHRPNQIGMSCVELEKIEGRRLFIKNFDLLDDTPVLDIKPYVPYCDSFPDSKTGWIPDESQTYILVSSETFEKQANWVKEQTGFDLMSFASVQLSEDPTNRKRKRIEKLAENQYVLAYRTWRIQFSIDNINITLERIFSGYSFDDLAEQVDKYKDKDIHRKYIKNEI